MMEPGARDDWQALHMRALLGQSCRGPDGTFRVGSVMSSERDSPPRVSFSTLF